MQQAEAALSVAPVTMSPGKTVRFTAPVACDVLARLQSESDVLREIGGRLGNLREVVTMIMNAAMDDNVPSFIVAAIASVAESLEAIEALSDAEEVRQ